VVDADGFEGTAQSAESAGGGLTTRLQVQVLLGEPNKIKGLDEKSKPFSFGCFEIPTQFPTNGLKNNNARGNRKQEEDQR
jgi:hypothetical protein